jgi:TATA-box binding protein (TBP) (component of TFIID and TFIIIB)
MPTKKNVKPERGSAEPVDRNSFKKLPISTQTVMAYTNCSFDLSRIFEKLPVEETTETNVKKLVGSRGKIYQLKYCGKTRGLESKKGNFRNQLSVCIFLDKMITVKVFRTGKLHLTGCKGLEHQQQAIVELLNQVKTIESEEPLYVIADDRPLTVVLDVVMVNVDFNLGFDVDQKKLDHLLQKNSNDFYSIFEPLVNTSVNIKLVYKEPENIEYQQIIFEPNGVKFAVTTDCPSSRPKRDHTHTFLVFSSSKVIQSGRYYDQQMGDAYQKFIEFIESNRKYIELRLKEKEFDISKIRGLKGASFNLQPENNKIYL